MKISKKQIVQQSIWDEWTSIQNIFKKDGFLPHTICEIISRYIKDLNVYSKTLRILEDNTVENFHDFWASKGFLNKKQKGLNIKL